MLTTSWGFGGVSGFGFGGVEVKGLGMFRIWCLGSGAWAWECLGFLRVELRVWWC